MNIYCVVSIDTECDRGSNWRNLLPIQYTSVIHHIPHVLQKIFDKHLVKPTYLLSPEVIESKACVETLTSLASAELGSHLHAEFVEPGKKPLGAFTGEIQAMYGPEIEKVKLENLTRLFKEKIGRKPTSFRAGRWGISPYTFDILESLGYLVDSSVTPYFSWKFPQYTLDYKTALDVPYFPSVENFLKPGHRQLLQVPVTIFSYYGFWMNRQGKYFPSKIKDALLKLPLWRPQWLRPTYSNFSQMKHVIDAYIRFHPHEKNIVLNMMFHSVEILPEENPYGFDQKRIGVFLNSMEKTFEYLHSLNAQFVGLSDIHPLYSRGKD